VTGTIRTDRFQGGLLVALLAGALGLIGNDTVLFMAASVGLVYAAYGYATAPTSASFAVSRTVSDDAPTAGQDVTVTLTVRNTSDGVVPDVRIVDGVPDALGVVEGSPRHATPLHAGESTTFSYVVRARRGTHEFGDATVVARNVSADAESRTTVAATTSISVNADVGVVPLASQTSQQAGMVPTDVGGDGVEFYQSRDYHHSDPMNRVDWKRYARTRELTTVEFREERAATVVVLVDVRHACRISRREDEPDAVSLSKYATARLVSHLLDDGNRVGVAFYGYDEEYLEPGVGDAHAVRVRNMLEADAESSFPVVTDGGVPSRDANRRVDWLRKRLPSGAQILFVSPVPDDEPVRTSRRLQASGHEVRLLAPDVTSTETAGATVDRIQWLDRIGTVREAGVKAVAWSPDEPIRSAFERARRRWSQ
jgi:uncharacterized repeat protein (TIGR01451 family)